MIDSVFAQSFAHAWVAAWNAHDLDEILSHYEEDFEMHSPVITQLNLNITGILQGRAMVKSCWKQALQLVPNLKFELISTLVGNESITLFYRGARERLSAEVFFFNGQGKVTKAIAHYCALTSLIPPPAECKP